MSDFILNLARRGAGLSSLTTIQPAVSPDFSADIYTAHSEEQEMATEGESANELAQGMQSTSPNESAESAPSGVQTEMTTDAQQEQPREFKTVPEQRSKIFHQRFQTEPSDIPSSNDVTPRIHEVAVPETSFIGQSPAPTSDLLTSQQSLVDPKRSSALRVRLAAQIIPAESVTQPQIFIDAAEAVESITIATPAAVNEPVDIAQASGKLLAYNRSQQPGAGGAVPQPIQVRIGTIEVRANTPPASQPSRPQASAPRGFDDYAMIRNYKRWERY